MRGIVLGAMTAAAIASAGIGASARAEGDPRPMLWEFLTVDRYVRAILQVGVLAVRDEVEFEYEHISADPYTATVSMHGLTIFPDLPWLGEEPCTLTAERATLRSTGLHDWDTLKLRVDLIGAEATANCVPFPFNMELARSNVQMVALDRTYVDLAYQVGPGRLTADVHATLTDLVSVDANLDFSYFAIHKEDDITAYLSSATLMVENLGLYEILSKGMPPPFRDPEAVKGIVTEGLSGMMREVMGEGGSQGTGPQVLPSNQQSFVTNVAREVSRFVADPGVMVLEVQPTEDVFLNTGILEEPAYLFEQLNPVVSGRPSSRDQIVPTVKLRAALTAPQMLQDPERFTIGRALVTGVGAPRSVAAGRALLQPLADAGNGEAALVIANAVMADDPEGAYVQALAAGAASAKGAAAALDAMEAQLATADVLRLQAADGPGGSEEAYASITAMRSLALDYLSGIGQPRSYQRAYYWASLASAAGDRASASLLGEIVDRMRFRGEAATQAWREVADAAEKAALETWLERNMALTFTKP